MIGSPKAEAKLLELVGHRLSSWGFFAGASVYVPIILSATAVFFGRKYKYDRTKGNLIKDQEFSGFTMVKVYPIHLPNTQSHQNVASAYTLPTDLAEGAHLAGQKLAGKLDKNDVIIASYPKSGTTWLSEVVFLIMSELNWKASQSSNLESRIPYMEYIWPGVEAIISTKPPRLIKTHLPFTHLPQEIQDGSSGRVIYIARDPRDVTVSYYHFARCFSPAGYKNKEGIRGFTERFLQDRLPYSPWTEHVLSYALVANKQQTNDGPKVLVVNYAMIKENPHAIIQRIEAFLNDNESCEGNKRNRLSEDQIKQIANYCSFEAMAQNPATNFSWMREYGLWSCSSKDQFMRRGEVGDHRVWLTPKQSQEIADKTRKAGLSWVLASQDI